MQLISPSNSSGTIDDNGVFYYSQPTTNAGEYGIRPGDLLNFIWYHSQHLQSRYYKLRRYYRGHHDIIDKDNKKQGRPDSRIVVNYPAELVNNSVGYFVGTPAKIDYIDQDGAVNKEFDSKVTEFIRMNNFDDKLVELAKQVDIYGRSHLLIYQNEDKETRVATLDPLHAFVIYDDSIEPKPLFAVYYRTTAVFGSDNESITTGEVEGTLYTRNESINFIGSSQGVDIAFDEPEMNQFGDVQIIEAVANDERKGVFEDVISIIDAVDEAMSAKANDINYFSNAILKVINATMDQDKVDDMLDNHFINIKRVANGEAPIIEFVDKPDADGVQERFLDRAVDFIYTKAMVANFNDDVFGTASGTALEFKLQAMSNNASMKARKFTSVIRKLFKLGFTAGATLPIEGNIRDLSIKFTKTVPHNIADEINTAVSGFNSGLLDHRTALSLVSSVEDPEQVLDALKREKEATSSNAMDNLLQSASGDFADQLGNAMLKVNAQTVQNSDPTSGGDDLAKQKEDANAGTK